MAQLKLPRWAMVRAPALLPMLYTVSEISKFLGIPDHTLRDWLVFHGAPHIRDKKKHLWINGVLFADWVNSMRKKKLETKSKLAENEAYCVRCNKPVKLIKPVMKPVRGRFILIHYNHHQPGRSITQETEQKREISHG